MVLSIKTVQSIVTDSLISYYETVIVQISVLPEDGDGASPRNVASFKLFDAADGPRRLCHVAAKVLKLMS